MTASHACGWLVAILAVAALPAAADGGEGKAYEKPR